MSVAGLGIYFGNLVSILRNLTWIFEFWSLEAVSEAKFSKFLVFSMKIQLKSSEISCLRWIFSGFSEYKRFDNGSTEFEYLPSVKNNLDNPKFVKKSDRRIEVAL